MVEEEVKTEVAKEPEVDEKPKTMLEETKEAIAELRKEKEEILEIKKQLAELKSDRLLSGTAGVRKEAEPVGDETNKEYRQRIEKELAEGKTDFT